MAKFRKKPVVIDAMQWDGSRESLFEISNWSEGAVSPSFDRRDRAEVPTLEGVMLAAPGDWIICGVNGEYYPCKPDIFEKTYEPVEDSPDG